MKQTTLDLIKNINENTFIPATTQNELFELFQLDTVADLRKVSRNFMKLYELLEHLDNQTSSATSEKKGIVKLGTEIGTSLEGNRLAEILGIEFGGNIQDTGNKTKGKFYFDSVTKFYYECIENTNLTYNESSKFRAISNKPLSDKVENLHEITQGTLNASQIAGFSSATLYKKAGVVFLNVDDNQRLNGRTAGNVILTLPDGFRPRNRTSFSGNTSLGKACVFNVETDGRVILMSDIKLSGYLYFNVSFLAK